MWRFETMFGVVDFVVRILWNEHVELRSHVMFMDNVSWHFKDFLARGRAIKNS